MHQDAFESDKERYKEEKSEREFSIYGSSKTPCHFRPYLLKNKYQENTRIQSLRRISLQYNGWVNTYIKQLIYQNYFYSFCKKCKVNKKGI